MDYVAGSIQPPQGDAFFERVKNKGVALSLVDLVSDYFRNLREWFNYQSTSSTLNRGVIIQAPTKAEFEKAKIAAAQDPAGTSKYIERYGDLTQDQRYEVAKIAAAQHGRGTSLYIQKYGDLNPDQMYEVAKIAGAQDSGGTSLYIQNYVIIPR